MDDKYTKITDEQYYFINMMISCVYQEKPRPQLTISRLKLIRDSRQYDDREKTFLNVVRERHKEELKRKYNNVKEEFSFKRRISELWKT